MRYQREAFQNLAELAQAEKAEHVCRVLETGYLKAAIKKPRLSFLPLFEAIFFQLSF